MPATADRVKETATTTGTGTLTLAGAVSQFRGRRQPTGEVVSHFTIMDRLTGGNYMLHGALTTSKTVNSRDPAPKFLIGALDVTLA